MAVAFRAATANGTGALTSTSAIGKRPTGTTNGDILIALVGAAGEAKIAKAPTGWNKLSELKEVGALYWKAASEEPAEWTWELTKTRPNVVGVIAVSGGENATPLWAEAEVGKGSTAATPTVTTTNAPALILDLLISVTELAGSGPTYTFPEGTTLAAQTSTTLALNYNEGIAVGYDNALKEPAGKTTARTITASASQLGYQTYQVAIYPAAVPQSIAPVAKGASATTSALRARTFVSPAAKAAALAIALLSASTHFAPSAAGASAASMKLSARTFVAPTAQSASASSASTSAATRVAPTARTAAAAQASTSARTFMALAAHGASTASGAVSARSLLVPRASTVAAGTCAVTIHQPFVPAARAAGAASGATTAASRLSPVAHSAGSAGTALSARVLLAPAARSDAAASTPVTASTHLSPVAHAVGASQVPLAARTFLVPAAHCAAQAATPLHASVTAKQPLSPNATSTTRAIALVRLETEQGRAVASVTVDASVALVASECNRTSTVTSVRI